MEQKKAHLSCFWGGFRAGVFCWPGFCGVFSRKRWKFNSRGCAQKCNRGTYSRSFSLDPLRNNLLKQSPSAVNARVGPNLAEFGRFRLQVAACMLSKDLVASLRLRNPGVVEPAYSQVVLVFPAARVSGSPSPSQRTNKQPPKKTSRGGVHTHVRTGVEYKNKQRLGVVTVVLV